MEMDIENPMVNDAYWPEHKEYDPEEWYRKIDEMYEDECEREAAYIRHFGWGRANGYHF